MCFSAEASFTAAVLLSMTGSVTLKNTSSPSQFFLAGIPLLFAIQQFSEGLVWLHISQNVGIETMFRYAQRSFLAFAFIIWPIWIPLSLAVLEKISWRRVFLYFNLACGIALSLWNLSYAINQEPHVEVVNHSLQYIGNIPSQYIIYPLIILLPCFVSSLKNIQIFGWLITIGYVIAYYFYVKTFTSVWCFFAALVSLSIYKILKDNQVIANEKAL